MFLDLFYTAILTLIVGIGSYALVLFTLAHFGGWAELARDYKTNTVPPEVIKGRTILTQIGGYKNCITLSADSAFIYVAIMPLLRPYHPPLAIPFDDIVIDRNLAKTPRGCVALHIGSGVMTLYFYETDIMWIEARYATLVDIAFKPRE